MKKNEPVKTAEETYPELNGIAERMRKDILRDVNYWSAGVRSDCPYKAQCVLEMLISKLERAV
jgi:hypothetical protein